MEAGKRGLGYYAVKLIDVRSGAGATDGSPAVQIASVRARDMTEAIAVAMRRYPGHLAVHGERH